MIIGIVWALNFETGEWKMRQVIEDYARCQIFPLEKRHNRIKFSNGDIWRIASSVDNVRGIRANICYIDARIEETIVRQVIQPCLSRPPYSGVRYFFPAPFEEEEELE